jgi:hypothetical protein
MTADHQPTPTCHVFEAVAAVSDAMGHLVEALRTGDANRMQQCQEGPLWEPDDWDLLVDEDADIEEWSPEDDWGDEEWIEAPPRRCTVDILRPDLFGPVPDGWPARPIRTNADSSYGRSR